MFGYLLSFVRHTSERREAKRKSYILWVSRFDRGGCLVLLDSACALARIVQGCFLVLHYESRIRPRDNASRKAQVNPPGGGLASKHPLACVAYQPLGAHGHEIRGGCVSGLSFFWRVIVSQKLGLFPFRLPLDDIGNNKGPGSLRDPTTTLGFRGFGEADLCLNQLGYCRACRSGKVAEVYFVYWTDQ